MKPQFLTNLMRTKRTVTLFLVNLAVVCCGVTIMNSEAAAQRVYFDIKKGNSVEGDVSVSAGAIRTNNGFYRMRIDGGNVNLKKLTDFRVNGWIRNNAALGNQQLKEINFDQYYGTESPSGIASVTEHSTYTKITMRNVACREFFKVASNFSTGYRVWADVELTINKNGSGTFKVTVTRIISGFVGVNQYGLGNLPANFPAAKSGVIASGAPIFPTTLSVRK
jgi:hypothetical protein